MPGWNELSKQQRAALTTSRRHVKLVSSRWAADKQKRDPYSEAIRTAKLLDRDMAHARAKAAKEENKLLIQAFQGEIKKIAPGRAYGAGELTRQCAGAMPMQYFRRGGGC